VVVSTPVLNRNRSEIEGLIGLFGNVLPLRTDLAGDPTFGELLGRVRQVTLGAYAHQDVPFEMLAAELELDRSPLPRVMFALQNEPLDALTTFGLTLDDIEISGTGSEFDLALFAENVGQGLKVEVEYDGGLFDGAFVDGLASDLQALLEGIAADPGRRVSELLGGKVRRTSESASHLSTSHL
jgi:aspartate racemase